MLERAKALHDASVVVDLHNDWLLKNRFFGRKLERRGRPQLFYTPWRTDLDAVRIAEGGLHALGFALWAGMPRWSGPNGRGAHAFTSNLMDRLERIVAAGTLALARTAADIRTAREQKVLAAFVGIEGGQAIEDDLEKLESFHRRGVRYMGLTWNTSPSFARSASQAGRREPDGLTAFGRDVVRKMNELHMMIDLAHASERTAWDILECSEQSPFDSHTGAMGAHAHPRNIKDDLIKAIAERGGVIGVIFCPTFLRGLTADLHAVADHIEQIARVGGAKAVALGSDFDGFIPLVRGMRDVRDLPRLTAILLERGHSEDDVRGFLGGNFLRYFEQVCG